MQSTPSSATNAQHLSQLTFEQALARLQDIVAQLEGGALTLEATIAAFRDGSELAAHCQRTITDAELRITRLAPPVDNDGAPVPANSATSGTPGIPGL